MHMSNNPRATLRLVPKYVNRGKVTPFRARCQSAAIVQVNAADHSGSQWLTCFQDTGAEILGVDAQTLGELRDRDEAAFDDIFHKVNFKSFTFKVRAKMDTYNVSTWMG